MTRRVEFTVKLACLLKEMNEQGEFPILDWVYRDQFAQNNLYRQGKSQIDGIRRQSKHQMGLAADIYFLGKDRKLDLDKKKYEYWHKVWTEKYGGQPAISWDLPHFEI